MNFKPKKTYPREKTGNLRIILLLFSISLVFFVLAKILPHRAVKEQKKIMVRASEIMKEAVTALKTNLIETGIGIVKDFDINQTGLIGVEFSPITTTVGNLKAKRTTTNPNTAALVVHLLQKAGVKKGNTVAVGASGSFPALIVAVLSAAKAMDIDPQIICSLGASQWGANRQEFHFLKMLECLGAAGIFNFRPAAVSLGGERDIGEGMSDEARTLLIGDIEESGLPFIQESNLSANVQTKMQIYEESAGEKGIECFVNIGGSWSNMGIDSEILNLKPGLAKIRKIPPPEERGLVFEMAAREIPVIHLLYIKGLVEHYGLPWDPQPLPEAGKGLIYQKIGQDHPLFPILGGLYLLVFILVISLYKRFKRFT
jgi:poly-gamma-glutamate system protein